jgi:hypothetical protein
MASIGKISSMNTRKRKATSEEIAFILDRYVKRWQRWAAAGLEELRLASTSKSNTDETYCK